MAEMTKRPKELKKVQEELAQVVRLERKVHESDLEKLSCLKCEINETLHLHRPIPLLHETAVDTQINGCFIPISSCVTINVLAIDRDEESWEDAEVFRPLRFAQGIADFKGNFEFIPFGSSQQSCLGMKLGLYTLELAMV